MDYLASRYHQVPGIDTKAKEMLCRNSQVYADTVILLMSKLAERLPEYADYVSDY